MFINNKYTRWYYSIIESAKIRTNNSYIEKHHIIPTSLGGKTHKDNIVELLPREHYICHLLLTKMTEGQAKYKMAFALSMMHKVKNIGEGRYTPSSKLYEYARKEFKSALDNYWTDEQKLIHATKISKATKGKIKSESAKERLRNKHWTEKAKQNRLDNCLKAAKARKGSEWSQEHRKSREDTYFLKNEKHAKLIFEMIDESNLSINKISKQLGIDWYTVKTIISRREGFENKGKKMTRLDSVKKFIAENEHRTFEYPEVPQLENEWKKAEWIFRESHLPYLQMDIQMPYAEILTEARAVRHRFVRHREGDGEGWMSLCIHGMSAEQTDAPNMYGYTHDTAPYKWTDIADLCPVTTDYFKNKFPFQFYHRLRFMLLEPGGYIVQHSDNMQSNLGAATNISLNNPAGCKFVTERGLVPFRDTGSVFMFNNHYQHVVFNDSNEERIHIIVHGAWDGRLWNPIINRSYEMARNGQNIS